MSEFSVTPLGTVSPYPKGKCNCPGFLVQSGKYKLLLDCGSGVSRLLNFPDDLKNLMIILSHMHIDHYSDLGSIANAAYCYHNLGYLNDKVKVFYPFDYIGNNIQILRNYKENSFIGIESYFNEITLKHSDMELRFLKNIHDVLTFSVKIMSNNVSVVYTSDTGFNEKLIDFCRGVDLLISEATFLKGQKCTNGHMFAYQAGIIAREAGVNNLMLTHFWPEIDKERYVEEAKEIFDNTFAAEEGKKFVLRKEGF